MLGVITITVIIAYSIVREVFVIVDHVYVLIHGE